MPVEELKEPFDLIIRIIGHHSLQLIIWATIGLLIGVLLSVFLVFKLHKKQWFKRSNGWKYISWIHYPALPLITAFICFQIGLWWAGRQVIKEELNHVRVYTEGQTSNFVTSNFEMIVDTSFLKSGQLDSALIDELRDKVNLRKGSTLDKMAKATVSSGTSVLLYVLTNRTAKVAGVKDEHLKKLIGGFSDKDAKMMHSALMDITEYLAWKAIRGYMLGILFSILGIGLLALLPFLLEIYFNGRKHRRSLTTSHPQD